MCHSPLPLPPKRKQQSHGKNSYEIKGVSQEMVEMVIMSIIFNGESIIQLWRETRVY